MSESRESKYWHCRWIPGRGLCGIMPMLYTVGLFIGIDVHGFGTQGRYCYPYLEDAIHALRSWNGDGDPPGDWIKFKGGMESRARLPDVHGNFYY